jgi:hypothetical protein
LAIVIIAKAIKEVNSFGYLMNNTYGYIFQGGQKGNLK